jgi:hypothetical protein
MRKYFGFLAVVVAVTLVSCGDKTKDILSLNDELTTINDSLFYKGQIWGEEFKIGFNSGDYTPLQAARVDVQGYIERSIVRVQQLEDVGGSEEFRKTELAYLQFEKDSIMPKMIAFENLPDSATQEDINAAYLALISCAKEEQSRLEQLRKVQKAYAEKNKIELKESSLSHIE